jgi:hypothetical protein
MAVRCERWLRHCDIASALALAGATSGDGGGGGGGGSGGSALQRTLARRRNDGRRLDLGRLQHGDLPARGHLAHSGTRSASAQSVRWPLAASPSPRTLLLAAKQAGVPGARRLG